jgi:hypothetical protein
VLCVSVRVGVCTCLRVYLAHVPARVIAREWLSVCRCCSCAGRHAGRCVMIFDDERSFFAHPCLRLHRSLVCVCVCVCTRPLSLVHFLGPSASCCVLSHCRLSCALLSFFSVDLLATEQDMYPRGPNEMFWKLFSGKMLPSHYHYFCRCPLRWAHAGCHCRTIVPPAPDECAFVFRLFFHLSLHGTRRGSDPIRLADRAAPPGGVTPGTVLDERLSVPWRARPRCMCACVVLPRVLLL